MNSKLIKTFYLPLRVMNVGVLFRLGWTGKVKCNNIQVCDGSIVSEESTLRSFIF